MHGAGSLFFLLKTSLLAVTFRTEKYIISIDQCTYDNKIHLQFYFLEQPNSAVADASPAVSGMSFDILAD